MITHGHRLSLVSVAGGSDERWGQGSVVHMANSGWIADANTCSFKTLTCDRVTSAQPLTDQITARVCVSDCEYVCVWVEGSVVVLNDA